MRFDDGVLVCMDGKLLSRKAETSGRKVYLPQKIENRPETFFFSFLVLLWTSANIFIFHIQTRH